MEKDVKLSGLLIGFEECGCIVVSCEHNEIKIIVNSDSILNDKQAMQRALQGMKLLAPNYRLLAKYERLSNNS